MTRPNLSLLQIKYHKQRNLVLGRGNFFFPAVLIRWEEYFDQDSIGFDEQEIEAIIVDAGLATERLKITGRLVSLFGYPHTPVELTLFCDGEDLHLLLEASLQTWNFRNQYPALPKYVNWSPSLFEQGRQESFFYQLALDGAKVLFSTVHYPKAKDSLQFPLTVWERSRVYLGLNIRGNLTLDKNAFGSLSAFVWRSGEVPKLPVRGYIALEYDPIKEIDVPVDSPDKEKVLYFVHDLPKSLSTTMGPVKLSLESLGLFTKLSESYSNDPDNGLNLRARITIGNFPVDVIIEHPVGSKSLGLTALMKNFRLPSITDTMSFLGVDDAASLLPSALAEASLSIASLELGVGLDFGELAVRYFDAAIQLGGSWELIPDLLAVKNLYARILVEGPGSSDPDVDLRFGGIVVLGDEDKGAQIHVAVDIPDDPQEFSIYGELIPGTEIDVGAIFSKLGLPFDVELSILDLSIYAQPKLGAFQAHIEIATDWEIDLIVTELVLKGVTIDVEREPPDASAPASSSSTGAPASGPSFYGSIEALTEIFDTEFLFRAEKDDDGWGFSGQLAPGEVISLGKVADTFFSGVGLDFPSEILPDIVEMGFDFHTATRSYGFRGGFIWNFNLWNLAFHGEAYLDLRYDRPKPPAGSGKNKNPPKGELSGDIQARVMIESLDLEVDMGYSFDKDERTFTIAAEIADKVLKGVYRQKKITQPGTATEAAEVASGDGNSQVLELFFYDKDKESEGLAVAEFFQFFIDIVSKGFKLPGIVQEICDIIPSSIRLKKIAIDLKRNTIEAVIGVDKPLLPELEDFFYIHDISFVLKKANGRRKVYFRFTGKIMGQVFPEKNPFEWDVLDGQPPAAGVKPSLLEVRYLAMGQHALFTGGTQYRHVDDAVAALREVAKPAESAQDNPFTRPGGLKFDKDSNWLIAFDFSIMDTFAVQAIFNDPILYGVAITVRGPKAKNLNGFRFEIMYRKISEDIGVYSAELQLPDQMRRFEFGAATIILPVIALDIYTNGNFKIDVGFPASITDFRRSGSVQLFPFVGYGGFYFAVLNGITSSNVPRLAKGTFSPVIEFGIGFSIGLGKNFEMGPLKAGIQITINGIITGVLAWYRSDPGGGNGDGEMYFQIRGQVGLQGLLYGEVDFKIIKASISIEIYAGISLVIESYKAIPIELVARVTARASIKILFVRIHFSFSATIRQNFTIGSDSTPPWPVAGGYQNVATSGGNTPKTLAMKAGAAALASPASSTPGVASSSATGSSAGVADWGASPSGSSAAVSAPVVAASVSAPANLASLSKVIRLVMIPALSKAAPSDLRTNGTDPKITCAPVLFIKNAIDKDAAGQKDIAGDEDGTNGTSDFDSLSLALLDWLLKTMLGDAETVSYDELGRLYKALSDLEKGPASVTSVAIGKGVLDLSYKGLLDFFKNSGLSFRIEGVPSDPADMNGTFFPMFPGLALGVGGKEVDFSTEGSVDEAYLNYIDGYFDELNDPEHSEPI